MQIKLEAVLTSSEQRLIDGDILCILTFVLDADAGEIELKLSKDIASRYEVGKSYELLLNSNKV